VTIVVLTRRASRTAEEERELARMKAEMARRVMSSPAPAVYDVNV
jgi:hypothetical protein